MADGRGLPLLSGPLPASIEDTQPEACRKCNKEFNLIFTRPRKCNHCGYSYCHSCSDYHALMPRLGHDTGYDAMSVCAFCIEYLTITAGGRTYLKTLTLAKLKKYVNVYNIKIDRAVEKDDLIDGILSIRRNGCLPPENENFYRKYSVPNKMTSRPRGLFSRTGQGSGESTTPPPRPPTNPVHDFPRPDLAPDGPPPRQSNPFAGPPPPPPRPQQQQYNPPPYPPPPPHSTYPGGPQHQHQPPPPQFHPPRPPSQNTGHPGQGYPPGYNPHYANNPFHNAGPPPVPPHASRPQPQQHPQQGYPYRPRTAPDSQRNEQPTASSSSRSTPPPPPPRPREAKPVPTAPPTLNDLLTMPSERIGSLSIGNLKSVLNANHVNPGQVLEKSDLVQKVLTLVGAEKAERERQRLAEEREEMERVQREIDRMEEEERARERREREDRSDRSSPPSRNLSSSPPAHHHREQTPGSNSSPPPARTPSPSITQKMASTLERSGLCVICQDDEANIAIVDCGHLAMCRGCSDMVMASSRECPLCRTRIVTEQRLLRIYKT